MMTVAELSHYSLDHGLRLTAFEERQKAAKAELSENRAGLERLEKKLDRMVWGIVSILGTALIHLTLALLKH